MKRYLFALKTFQICGSSLAILDNSLSARFHPIYMIYEVLKKRTESLLKLLFINMQKSIMIWYRGKKIELSIYQYSNTWNYYFIVKNFVNNTLRKNNVLAANTNTVYNIQ